MSSNRRQFLRNTALATLSAGLIPSVLKAENANASKALKACDPVTLDYYGQGPFYKAGAPDINSNQLATGSETGTRLIISGIVKTLDCTSVIPGTRIDLWHANHDGAYDNSGFNLRGVTYSNSQGFYIFETILPGKYLNGSSYRPRHIHVKITPPGKPTVTTQLYFEGDTDIPGDAAASISSGTYDASHRIITLTDNGQGKQEGTWDIIVSGFAAGNEDLHADKGLIYRAGPNPFTDKVEIFYGVFQPSRVTLEVFDMKGSQVAVLDQRQMKPEKYTAVWNPGADLPQGLYWVTLKINDLQTHYLKLMKA